MSEEAFLSFVNAWHVTSSLPLSDVMVLHIECCVENKFPSSHPPGLLWFQMKGGETIHGHYHTHTRTHYMPHRYVGLLLSLLPLFCLSFTFLCFSSVT